VKLWRCPTCETGIRAPGKLRMVDVRRYCLTCSAKTGVLVQRTIPSRDAERARAKLLRQEHEVKARERTAAKRTTHAQSERGQLEAFARLALKLEAFARLHGKRVDFKIRLPAPATRHAESTGHAYGSHRFVITAGSDAADARGTILHEIAHCAAGYTDGPHGDRWRSVFTEATRELTGETPTPVGRTHQSLHSAAIDCVRRWISDSGTQ
jgi:hypothetical protein